MKHLKQGLMNKAFEIAVIVLGSIMALTIGIENCKVDTWILGVICILMGIGGILRIREEKYLEQIITKLKKENDELKSRGDDTCAKE